MSIVIYLSGLLLGIGLGLLIGLATASVYPPNIIPTAEQINNLENLKHDCTFPEYYYDDNKKALCDMIKVHP